MKLQRISRLCYGWSYLIAFVLEWQTILSQKQVPYGVRVRVSPDALACCQLGGVNCPFIVNREITTFCNYDIIDPIVLWLCNEVGAQFLAMFSTTLDGKIVGSLILQGHYHIDSRVCTCSSIGQSTTLRMQGLGVRISSGVRIQDIYGDEGSSPSRTRMGDSLSVVKTHK